MSGLFGKVVEIDTQAMSTQTLCGCELEDGAGGVGKCYDVDCCACEQFTDD
ncbi:MAG: hypothetical protein XD93_0168 [candidate division WS6 bacterium 34_10]|uniref:Uncharacterized protein n=1 Tax=candidate division WS6 bacterium 34_10 TaxID=1641389 RepID=A0A117M0M3_9BACT|nr:MAG: hypothetical protein XD93_0168 [candidate division WS6 bacterium 34_10]